MKNISKYAAFGSSYACKTYFSIVIFHKLLLQNKKKKTNGNQKTD